MDLKQLSTKTCGVGEFSYLAVCYKHIKDTYTDEVFPGRGYWENGCAAWTSIEKLGATEALFEMCQREVKYTDKKFNLFTAVLSKHA